MNKSRRTTEYLIYFLFWGAVILSPFWGLNITSSAVDWDHMLKFWAYLLPAFVLFFINNNILMPFFLYKKGGLHYVLYLICIIVLVYYAFLIVTSTFDVPAQRVPPMYKHEFSFNEGDVMPPRRGPHMLAYPKYEHVQQTVHDVMCDNVCYTISKRPPKRDDFVYPEVLIHPNSVQILLIVFTLIFNISVRLFFLTLRKDDHLDELEKQKLRTELDYLKYQINPHFFMNTLNNIHALIDIDKEKAQNSLIELSKMMRHVLYDASSSFVPLAKEVEFLNSYIDLMRLRYTDSLKIDCSFPDNVAGYEMPSLLFVSFVENAFKHGVSYNGNSFVNVNLSVDDNYISFYCANSCNALNNSESRSTHSGIGIDNVKKRLSLIYGDGYNLEIIKDSKEFCVMLKIPVLNDKMYIG